MLHLQAKSMSTLYPLILGEIDKHGFELKTRGKAIKEVEDVAFTLENPLAPIPLQRSRRFNTAYAVIEMLSLFTPGRVCVDALLYYNPNMEMFLNKDTHLFDGSYAERLTMHDQMRYAYEVLKKDPNSRRAVLDYYNAELDQHESLDICCTLNLCFRIRDGKLNATCYMRGNDILWGVPYNFTMNTFLQNVMATWLGVEIGTYTHVVGSAHYYMDKKAEVDAVIANPHALKLYHPLYKGMPKWDLKSPDDTFLDIATLFHTHDQYTHGRAISHKMKSECLNYFWQKILKPYCDKKM